MVFVGEVILDAVCWMLVDGEFEVSTLVQLVVLVDYSRTAQWWNAGPLKETAGNKHLLEQEFEILL